MASVTFQLNTALYPNGIKGATIRYGTGQTFDVLAALVAGGGTAMGLGGSFTVTDDSLISALNSDPVVVPAGGSSPVQPVTDVTGPITAKLHGVQDGDRLAYSAKDGVFKNVTVSSQVGIALPRIDFCGHSIVAAGGTTGSDQNGFPDRLAKALGARKRANIAQGGSIGCWVTATAQGDGGWSWVLNNFVPPTLTEGYGNYLPNTTLACVYSAFNDLSWIGAANFKPAIEAVKTMISRYCSAAVYDDQDPSWTYGGGTWGNQTSGWWGYQNSSLHYANAAGTWAQWTSPTDYPGGQIIAIGLAVQPGTVGAGGTMVLGLTVDGVAQNDITINQDKGGHADAENNKQNGIVLRLGRSDCGLGIPLGPGQHVIRLTLKSISAGNFGVDYAQIETDPADGPVIIVPGLYRATSATFGGYALWSGGPAHGPDKVADPMTDASIASANAQIQAALADFPGRCVYVDTDAVIQKNPALTIGDGAHPTNKGHALLAQAMYDAVIASGLLTDRVLQRTSIRDLGENDGGVWRPIGGMFGTSIGQAFSNSWVSVGAWGSGTIPVAGYRKELDGRVSTRGAVASGSGTGAPITPNWNAGWQPRGFSDTAVETYDGTTLFVGFLRINGSKSAAGAGQFFPTLNAKISGTGHFNSIDREWRAEA